MQTIGYSQLRDLMARKTATVINVLAPEYFKKAHIPGSMNISHESLDFATRVEEAIGSKEAPVIVYCASYSCDASKKAALKLEKEGFTNVMCYEGGTKEWQEKNAELSAA